jgi:hypothetical protein
MPILSEISPQRGDHSLVVYPVEAVELLFSVAETAWCSQGEETSILCSFWSSGETEILEDMLLWLWFRDQ